MPGPAARLGDSTAHGGSIVLGCPTVMMDGAPASRLTDMHACPMVTPGVPPIPHVGGPVVGPGVATVLVGKMPQATVGDMAVCVGPPDSIVKGSATVLIGTGGGGGAGGGGGGGGAGGATGALAGASASGVRSPTGASSSATALGDGRYAVRRDGVVGVEGDVYFVGWALQAIAALSGYETGRAALRSLRARCATVTLTRGEVASVRAHAGRARVSLPLRAVASPDDVEANGLAVEAMLWAADEVLAAGVPSAPEADARAEQSA